MDAIRLGVVGCGDVAFRTYLPALAELGPGVRVTGFSDRRAENAARAAAFSPLWSDEAAAFAEAGDLIEGGDLDAVLNLTPPAHHAEISAAALKAGLHVYTEKPIALSVARARELTALADAQGRLLLCAPGVMATRRFRWLRRVLDSGAIGRLTLAVGQMTGLGPAAWRDYTGDVAGFYVADTGPLLDMGVYLLHAVTGLMGPAHRVRALGAIALPQRTVRARSHAGETIEVTAPDHMLVHLELGDGGLAQILSSFAVAGSTAPALELHGTDGSVTIGDFFAADGRGSTRWHLLDGEPPDPTSSTPGTDLPTRGRLNTLIAAGVTHFAACLRGLDEPLLTAEHAVHVLDIITNAKESARTGVTLSLETAFDQDRGYRREEPG